MTKLELLVFLCLVFYDRLRYVLVSTPPKRGPMMAMSMMARGKKRAILCPRRVARASRAAGRWNTSEDTPAHRNTPYHISENKGKRKSHYGITSGV